MGHIRLGQLPRTRKWRDVVELVAVGADVSQVATATIRAADSAFTFVNNDSGYNQAVWLMTQLGLAAGEKAPLTGLIRCAHPAGVTCVTSSPFGVVEPTGSHPVAKKNALSLTVR